MVLARDVSHRVILNVLLYMLTNDAIEIEAKPSGLNATEHAIREFSKDGEYDTGWCLQAVVKNDTSSVLKDLEFSLRYYDLEGRFIGLDKGFALGSDDLARREDKSISIDLDITPSASKAVFSLKANKTNFIEKYSLLFFSCAIVVVAILFFLSNLVK